MGNFVKAAITALLLSLAAGCVTYPYQTSFAACDNAAGSCYEYCEQYTDDERSYAACHADCEESANLCFAEAYDRYRVAQSSYGYPLYAPAPWYGSYGRWYPDRGYFFSFDSYYGSRYYGGRRYRDRRRRYYDGRRRGGGGTGGSTGGSGATTPPPSSPPPAYTPPPTSQPTPPPQQPRTQPPPQPRTEPAPRSQPRQTPRNREDRRATEPK